MASQVLMTISRDEVERARLISEEKYILDTQSKLVHAKREGEARGHTRGHAEGHAEGKAEGVAENKLEIARKMKAIGRPEPEIAEITGLPLETILQMSKEM